MTRFDFPYFRILQTEATEVFFSATKLFQSQDVGLRRFLYLMIKEISPSSDEVFLNPFIRFKEFSYMFQRLMPVIHLLAGYHCHQLSYEGHEQ